MATLPDSPVHGTAYRLEPDDGTEITFRPDGPGDDLPWDVTWPDGYREWCDDVDVAALPGGALVPVPVEAAT